MADRARRTVVVVLIVLVVGAVAAGAAYGLHSLWQTAKQHFASDSCTVGGYDLDTDQAAVASTMVGAVTQYKIGHSRRATVLVLAAGLQESKLTNIPPGLRRSRLGRRAPAAAVSGLGARRRAAGQHRRAQGPAHRRRRGDPRVPRPPRQRAALADPPARRRRAGGADLGRRQRLRPARTGGEGPGARAARAYSRPGSSAASARRPRWPTRPPSRPRPRDQLGITTPQSTGRTVRVPGAGWQTAAWFVANADRLGIEQVAYAAGTGRETAASGRTQRRSKGRGRRHHVPEIAMILQLGLLRQP